MIPSQNPDLIATVSKPKNILTKKLKKLKPGPELIEVNSHNTRNLINPKMVDSWNGGHCEGQGGHSGRHGEHGPTNLQLLSQNKCRFYSSKKLKSTISV